MANSRRTSEVLTLICSILALAFEIWIYYQFIWTSNPCRIIILIVIIVAIIRLLFFVLLFLLDNFNKINNCYRVFEIITLIFSIVTMIVCILVIIAEAKVLSQMNSFYRNCPYTNYPAKIDEETITLGIEEDKKIYFDKEECESRRCFYYDYNPHSYFSKLYLCTFDSHLDKIAVERKSYHYSGGRMRSSTYTTYLEPKNIVCTKAVNNIGIDDYERYGKKEAAFFFRDCAAKTDLYYCSRADYPKIYSNVHIDKCPGKWRELGSTVLFFFNLIFCLVEVICICMVYSEFQNFTETVTYNPEDTDFQPYSIEPEERQSLNTPDIKEKNT